MRLADIGLASLVSATPAADSSRNLETRGLVECLNEQALDLVIERLKHRKPDAYSLILLRCLLLICPGKAALYCDHRASLALPIFRCHWKFLVQ